MDKPFDSSHPFSNDRTPIAVAGEFAVQTCTITDPVTSDLITVYGVYNTTTGVREAETRYLRNAIMIMHDLADVVQANGSLDSLQFDLPLH